MEELQQQLLPSGGQRPGILQIWWQAIKNFVSPQNQTNSIDLLNDDYKNYLLSKYNGNLESMENYLNGDFGYDFHDIKTLITYIEDRDKQAEIIKYLQEQLELAKGNDVFLLKKEAFINIINCACTNNVQLTGNNIKYALKLCSLVDCKETMQRKHNVSEKEKLAYIFGALDANQLFGGIQQNGENILQMDNENILSDSNFFLLYCITRNNDKLLDENQVTQLTKKMVENNFSMTENKIYIFSLLVLSLAPNSIDAKSASLIYRSFALRKDTDMLHMIPQYVWLHFFAACQEGALGFEWANTLSFDENHPYNISFNSENYQSVMQAFSTKKEGCRNGDIARVIVGKKIFINLEYQNRIGENVGKGGIWTGIALIVAGLTLLTIFGFVPNPVALSCIGSGIGIIAGFGGITYHNNKKISKEDKELNTYKKNLNSKKNKENEVKLPIPTKIKNAKKRAGDNKDKNDDKTHDNDIFLN